MHQTRLGEPQVNEKFTHEDSRDEKFKPQKGEKKQCRVKKQLLPNTCILIELPKKMTFSLVVNLSLWLHFPVNKSPN